MTLVNIGYGNFAAREHIIAVIGSDTAPAKRLIGEGKESRRVIDATCGKKTLSVIITDSEHIILSALTPETLASRTNSAETSEQS
ncbi:MAG: DUF370 domain-containing protein [Firmicutes bacterium]|nr:DUF370 domain-containing protein [Bacillota bacterium]